MDSETLEKLSLEDRKRMVREIYVRTPVVQKLLKKIEFCRTRSKEDGEPYCMAILGPLGSGKTELINHYLLNHIPVEEEDRTLVSAFKATVPSSPTLRSIAEAVAIGIGDPIPKGSYTRITQRLIKDLIPGCGTEIFFLDEISEVIDGRRGGMATDVTNWIKQLTKETRVPLVIAGLQEQGKQLLRTNKQLKTLFVKAPLLRNFSWNSKNPDSLKPLQNFLAAFESRLPFAETSGLGRLESARKIQIVSGGVIRSVMRLIRLAACMSIVSRESKLSTSSLRAALNELGRDDEDFQPTIENPFKGED